MNLQYISSKNNPLAVRLSKLRDKKYRREEGLFRFDGMKLFSEAVKRELDLEYVIINEERQEEIFKHIRPMIEEKNINTLLVSESVFEKLTEEKSPEGIICVAKHLDKLHKTDTIENAVKFSEDIIKERILLLESVRDAGNLGTIIRCANAFGIDRLIISSDCADLYNPKTIRGAMGAIFAQRIDIVRSIPDAVKALRGAGCRVFATALNRDAKKLGTFEFQDGDCVLVGNEGHGLSHDACDACDECIFIPMNEDTESLNASVAASICMWELRKV